MRAAGWKVDVYIYSFTSKSGGELGKGRGDRAPPRTGNEKILKGARVKTRDQDGLRGLPGRVRGRFVKGRDLRNLLRDLYQEAAGMEMIRGKYDVVFLTGPDVYPVTKLDTREVRKAASSRRLYVSSLYPFSGVANKFYFGRPYLVKKMASRLAVAAGGLRTLKNRRAWKVALGRLRGSKDPAHNAEVICKKVLRRRSIRVARSKMMWVKARTGGEVAKPHRNYLNRWYPNALEKARRELRGEVNRAAAGGASE